jgi:hypothetical protein
VNRPSVAAGDPFAYAANIKAQETLARLEAELRHELMDDEALQQPRGQMLRLRRRTKRQTTKGEKRQ